MSNKVRRQAVPRRGDPSYAELFEQAQRDYDPNIALCGPSGGGAR